MADKGLVKAEGRYRSLFEEAPISLWEEDFTEVSKFIDQLRAGGLGDLRRYFENNPEALGECASRVKVLDVNKCTLEQYGARSKQEFFDNLSRFFCEESYPFFLEEVLAIAKGETAFEGETVNKTLQGGTLYINLKWIVSLGNWEKYSRVIVSIMDITERKLAEEALKENTERLDVAQKTAGIGFWNLDLPDMKLTWTNGLKSVFELDPDDPTPTYEEFWSYVHPDDLEFVERQAEKQLKSMGEIATYIYKIVSKRGSVKYLDHRGQQILDNQGRPSRLYGSIQDITERKLAEEALHKSELKYKVVADNTYDWEFWLSPEGYFFYNSPSCHRITGLSPDELEADPGLLASIVHPEDLPLFHAHLSEERLLDHPGELEFRIVRPDEELRWIHHVCQPVFASHGEFIGMRGSNRDITERKAVEKELRARTEELDAFAHTVSHDLMGVLTLIEGFSLTALEANQTGNLDEERQSLDHIVHATKRMEGYVDGLLQYARAVRQEGQASRAETEEVLMGVLTDLEEALLQGGAQVIVKEDLPSIMANPVKLHQVFLNLIANSLKYMGNNPEPRIEVGAKGEGDRVILYIKDNGVGIPKDKLEAIFLPFERLENATGPGMGIGLATVKRAVEAWGGKVRAESELGEGSVFFFSASSAD